MRGSLIRRRLVLALGLLRAAAPIDASTISGRVLDADGNPVPRARVVWTPARSEADGLSDETANAPPAILGETRTNPDGRFRIALRSPSVPVSLRVEAPSLPWALLAGPLDLAGDRTLPDIELPPVASAAGSVSGPGARPVDRARVRVLSSPARDAEVVFFAESTANADGSFVVANAPAGARVLRVRAADLVPYAREWSSGPRPERVAMKIGGSVSGTVRDESGRPVSGAIVFSGDVGVRTDSAGRYRLSGVTPGASTIEAVLQDEAIARRGPVAVRAESEAHADLTLTRAASISGSVIDRATRRPVASARVSILDSGSPFQSLPARRVVLTDSRGLFRARGLPPGRFRVQADRGGYLRASLPAVAAGIDSPGSAAIALEPAASIAGRVVDEKGRPVRGARVRLGRGPSFTARFRRGASPAAFAQATEAVTGPEGAFRLEPLAASASVTVEAIKPGFAPAQRPGVALKTGQAVRDLELTLRAGLTARGRVVDEGGRAVADAEIRIAASENRGGRLAFRAGGANGQPDARTGVDGAFTVRGLGEGEYQVTASHEGFAAKTVPALRVGGKAPVAWAPITLTKGVGLAGAVRDEQGLPIAGAAVQVSGRADLAQTDTSGSFRFGDLARERPVEVQVTADGYARAARNATPPAENLLIVLGKTATIRGRVEDAASGDPIVDLTVSRSAGTGGRGRGFGGGGFGGGAGSVLAIHSEDGTFELTGVPPGSWTLRAAAPGYRAADASGIDVEAGEIKEEVVLSLKRGGVVRGRVIDAMQGVPIPNATVSWQPSGTTVNPQLQALSAGNGQGQSTLTDADGRFVLDGLPDGRVLVTASQEDYLAASRESDPSALAGELVIPLGSGGEISGAVVGSAGGSPVVGSQVRLLAEGDSGAGIAPQTVSSDAAGGFRFDHLAAGRYQLTAQGKAGSSAPQDLVLADGQRMDGVRISVASGALVDGTVSGLPAGQLGGVGVVASADGYRGTATTGDDGKFTLSDVPSGVVRFAASTSFRQGRSTATTVEIPEDTTEMPVEIAFEGLSRLAGQVTRGGKPMASLSVTAVPDPPDGSGQRASGLTDGAGQYDLEGLNDGGYQVSVSAPGVSYRKTFTVSGDTNGDITLPGATVSGSVTDATSGAPVEGAAVQLETGQETQAGAIRRAIADSNGFYSIADVDPGNYQATARASGYQLKAEAVAVDAGSSQHDFALEEGAGLKIQVADGLTGIPLGGVLALVFAADGTVAFQGSVALDATGTGEIPSLTPGRYAMHVFSSGYAERALPAITVPSDPIPLTMTPGGRVEVRSSVPAVGTLANGSGAPVLLSPFRLDGTVAATPPVTVWEHLAPGAYTLFVNADGQKNFPFTVAEGQTTQLALP